MINGPVVSISKFIIPSLVCIQFAPLGLAICVTHRKAGSMFCDEEVDTWQEFGWKGRRLTGGVREIDSEAFKAISGAGTMYTMQTHKLSWVQLMR